MRTDLFSEETYLDDSGLVDLLVADVLTEHLNKVRLEGWGWVEVFAEYGHEERSQFRQAPKRYRDETAGERTAREVLETRIETLAAQYRRWPIRTTVTVTVTKRMRAWRQGSQIDADSRAAHLGVVSEHGSQSHVTPWSAAVAA